MEFFPTLTDAHDWRQYFNGIIGGGGNNPFTGDDGDFRGWGANRYLDYYAPSNYRYNFSGVRFYWSTSNPITAGGGIKVFGTNDNMIWTELMHRNINDTTVGTQASSGTVQTGVTYSSGSAWPHSYSFQTTGYYKKYRLQWSDNTSGTSFPISVVSGVALGDLYQYSLYEIEFF